MKILRPLTGLALMLSLAGMPGCKKEAPQQMPPAPVVTGKSTTADVPVYRTYPAKTQSERTMPINARVEGILERKVFEQGSLVIPGQILYVIQPEPFKAERDAAQAELASAIAGGLVFATLLTLLLTPSLLMIQANIAQRIRGRRARRTETKGASSDQTQAQQG